MRMPFAQPRVSFTYDERSFRGQLVHVRMPASALRHRRHLVDASTSVWVAGP